jgi:hypothetical protein
MTLKEISHLIAERLGSIFRRDGNGVIAAFAADSPFQRDPYWQDLLLFNEYFHAETGQGLGAAHQTGWTGLAANLVLRRYRRDIPEFWRRQRARTMSPTTLSADAGQRETMASRGPAAAKGHTTTTGR